MRWILALGLVVVLSITSAAGAGTVTWNYNGGTAAANSWDCATSWSPQQKPTSDNDVLLGTVISANRTLTLDKDWIIKSLTVYNGTTGAFVYTLDRGSASRLLTINTGNLTVGTGAGTPGANLTNTTAANADYVKLVIPDSLAASWVINGPTLVGSVTGASPNTTITKTGAGLLTMAGSAGTYSGALTVNAGGLRFNATHAGLGNFLLTPTVASDLTMDGAGVMGLAASKSAVFLGNSNGKAIVSPGVGAAGLGRFTIGSVSTDCVSFQNLSRYSADLSGTQAGLSDAVNVGGALDLGLAGTTNALYLTLPSGSLQSAYVLATFSNGLTGAFDCVVYNGNPVVNPTNPGAFGGTHNLVYAANYIALVNPALSPKMWITNVDGSGGSWSAAPAYNSNDRLIMPLAGGTFGPPSGGAGPIRWTVGEFTASGGTLVNTYGTAYSPATNIWRVAADNGLSGNFTVAGTYTKIVNNAWNTKVTLDLDGNVNIQPGAWGSVGEGFYVRMRGIPTGNRTYAFNSASNGQCYSLQVDCSVTNLAFVAPSAGYNGVQTLNLNASNSATGAVYVNHQANTQTVTVSPTCDVSNLDLSVCHQTNYTDGAAWVPGRHYGNFIFSNDPGGYWGGGVPADRLETLRIAYGDMWVKSLTVNPVVPGGGTNATGTVTFLFDTDNNGITRNLTVDGDAKFGRSGSANRLRGIFKTNSSVVDINRDLIFYGNAGATANNIRHSYLLGGSAVIRVGRNFSVDNGSAAIQQGWDPGTSTFVFDNAFGGAQTITSAGGAFQSVPFYDVQINNPGGRVTLADNLVLKGDFDLAAGTIAMGTLATKTYIVFNGGIDCETGAQEIDIDNTLVSLRKVRIMAGSNTWVKMMSDLTVTDNLDIDVGCKLFLNGYTLTASTADVKNLAPGGIFSGVGTWTVREGGEIVGSGEIPEPTTLLLLGTGALGLLGLVRRRRLA